MATDLQLPRAPCSQAITVRNAEKSYINSTNKKSRKVFSELHVNVPAGKIYSLLGPSGCGKTTLLRCIVGRETLDEGHVLIFGLTPGSKKCGVPGRNVGYMPQETCVFETMTITECFHYYGAILGLSGDKIHSRMKYYEKTLKLPPVDTVTRNLSGGQGRRVSFAIALFHHPKLIVLDEPTVGIDPIVKSYMWKHLLDLSNIKNVSIILTTHYIEEARQSHMVGIMHGGKMAAEDTAENLIAKFNCQTLEEACLCICCQEGDAGDSNAKISKKNGPEDMTFIKSVISKARGTKHRVVRRSPFLCSRDLSLRWRPLKSVIIKYILFLFRFTGGLLFLTVLPSFIITIFHLTMRSSIKGVNVIVVNDDRGDLGSRYLASWDQNALAQTNYTSLPEAELALYDGKAYGLLHVGENFSEMLFKRVESGPFASDEVLRKGKLELSIDKTNLHIAMYVTYRIISSLQKLLLDVTNATIGDSPIVFNKEVYNFMENPTMDAITRSVVLIAMYYGAAAGTVLILFVEIHKGYMERSFVAGTTTAELIFGMLLVTFMVAAAQAFLALLILVCTFDGVSLLSWILIFLLVYSTAVSGTSYGLFVSLFFPNEHQLLIIAATSTIISGALTGAMWPLEAMPLFAQYFCHFTPLVYPIKALKIMMSNTWHLFYGQVLMAFAVLFIWFLLCLLVPIRFRALH